MFLFSLLCSLCNFPISHVDGGEQTLCLRNVPGGTPDIAARRRRGQLSLGLAAGTGQLCLHLPSSELRIEEGKKKENARVLVPGLEGELDLISRSGLVLDGTRPKEHHLPAQ